MKAAVSAVPAGAAPLLVVEDLSIALPGGSDRALALQGVSFELRKGEILCVVGESGSGKTVLSSALMGALPRGLQIAAGRITLGGEDLTTRRERAWRAIRGRRIAMIPQEPMAALNPSTRVGVQIEETFAIHQIGEPKERRSEALRLISTMGLADAEHIAAAYPHQLSGGQCQRICIAMALALSPEVLIADEPTTALDVTTQAQVLELIRSLREDQQKGVLFITHDLGVVAEIADRVAVMEKGRLVEIGDARKVLRSPDHPYTRALIAAVPSFAPPGRRRPGVGPEISVNVTGLCKDYGPKRVLHPTSLAVRRAHTLSIVGESGSGKSTLARLLVGLTTPSSGRATINGVDLTSLSGRRLRTARRAVQMIFQDPYGSLNPRRTVGSAIARAAELGGDRPGDARERARALLLRVGLSEQAYDRLPAAFSGGQRQRVGIARALAVRPQVLIADESVSALDVSVQAQILDLLQELQDEFGLTVVFITHDLRVAAQISDDIAVVKSGVIVEMGAAEEVLVAPKDPYTVRLLRAAPGRDLL